jgi:CheY-like chemotaxis protein
MSKAKILAVDDEAFNLDILSEYLDADGYEVILACNGVEALEKLEAHEDIDVIVLDRMMPLMSGMEFLAVIKPQERFLSIPVIMQTAAASHEQIKQGIDAGVFYYLTKPYEEEMLLSLVRSALTEARQKLSMRYEVRQNKQVLGLLKEASFRFRTLEDARALAIYIANAFPEPESVVYGLNELMINAVEHGNLGITYQEKTQLVLKNEWQSEVERRLSLPEQALCFAELFFKATQNNVTLTIKDQGQGFDYNNYLDLDPGRVTEAHGRGIATSRLISFDEMFYQGCGNEVVCRVYLTS